MAGAVATTLVSCSSAGGNGGGSDFASENVTVIVPFAAGGPTDTVTRLIADPLGDDLGVQVVVQNVEGAGGTVGAAEAATADADGYTLLVHHIGMSTAPALYPDLPYDPVEDFEPIGLITEVPMTIIANKDFEPSTFEEFSEYVKANTDTVTYAHAGVGAASHLCGLLIENYLGVDFQEVPYDGTGPAMADLIGGQVDFMCDQTTNTSGQIKANEVKAYAATTPERVASLPEVPTTTEEGAAEISVTIWHGLYAPKGTPPEVVERLVTALKSAVLDDSVITQMADLGTAPVGPTDATPQALETKLVDETQQWAGLLGEGG